MKGLSWLNAAGALGAVTIAVVAAGVIEVDAPAPREATATAGSAATLETGPDGALGLRDASGTFVPAGPYARIASAAPVADAVLVDLLEPRRLIAVSTYTATQHPERHRFAAKARLAAVDRLEPLLELRPDLVLLNGLGRPKIVARLRAAGLAVFDLGSPGGVETFRRTVARLAALLEVPERGLQYLKRWNGRWERVASASPAERGPRTLYVSIYGKQLQGAGRGTSYHDVLTAAGLHDVAAERHGGYPTYSDEEMLSFAPEVIVTGEGMGDRLCGRTGLGGLRPCRERRRLVELPMAILGAAGPEMLTAAESLRAATVGLRTAATPAPRGPSSAAP